ncbi:hypothetical protein AGMMS49983_05990 [Clostridia bacterium]|nr:hypothetical protein AGMMS49983_05990 [Clostridia bacterium]
MRVGVKFCGHCSPRREMTEVLNTLRTLDPETDFTIFSENPDADALLILNACETGCATRPDFPGPVILVTPESVDRDSVSPHTLEREIFLHLKKIRITESTQNGEQK